MAGSSHNPQYFLNFFSLQEIIEPFKEQLESYELEKRALLSRSEQAQGEVKKLATQYGALLGKYRHGDTHTTSWNY